MTRTSDSETISQLATYGYAEKKSENISTRPLLICDVDEVVLHLVDPFAKLLDEMGFVLRTHSFQLTGNIFNKETGDEATQEDVWRGLDQLFKEQNHRQNIVDGALEGLNGLSRNMDILFLTNMPHPYRELRIDHLKNLGLNFPLVTNTKSKVPAIKLIESNRGGPIGFIDDTPTNLEQVRDGTKAIEIFHFMANDDFRNLVPPIEQARVSTGDWSVAVKSIQTVLQP